MNSNLMKPHHTTSAVYTDNKLISSVFIKSLQFIMNSARKIECLRKPVMCIRWTLYLIAYMNVIYGTFVIGEIERFSYAVSSVMP